MTSLVLERERLQDYTKNGPKVTPTFSADSEKSSP